MQLYNVCTRKVYEKDGVRKTNWLKVGTLKVTDSGKKYLQLFHQPDTEFFVFNTEPATPVTQGEETDIIH